MTVTEVRPPITRFGRVLDTAFSASHIVCATTEGAFMALLSAESLDWKKIEPTESTEDTKVSLPERMFLSI